MEFFLIFEEHPITAKVHAFFNTLIPVPEITIFPHTSVRLVR